ncbi:MAG TPA: FAD-dependent oxidoreductase [Solirubrobacteraceae bacterium]|nr:FAD-dependent oxidoreductase [Solirubrobacteraceae bacterium]
MVSWWLAQAGPLAPAQQLEGARRADVCILGGGFTGLWTALEIKRIEPSLDVVVVEAGLCGTGASGRNGGFAMTFWHHFTGLERACGAHEAVRLARASDAAVAGIGEFCDEHAIAAGYRRAGWFWTASNQAQVGAWENTLAAIERQGAKPFERMNPDEIAARTGSPTALAGVFEPGSATVQPALLARGLLRVARTRGVQVFECSPVVAIERAGRLTVRTASGQITADRVVVAMGAWASQLRELRRAFVIVSSDMVVTDPVADLLRRTDLRDGTSISDSRLMVHYYRPTDDGRIAFGKGGGRLAYGARIPATFSGPSPIASEVTRSMRATYPWLAPVPIAASWTGPIDRTLDGLPFFCTLGRPDFVCGAGFSGNGVGPSALGGRILASMTLGSDDEWAHCGLVRKPPSGLPPEPFRYVGGGVVRGAVARKERAEDAGRRPDAIDVGLARLAPTGLVPVD